ncbi:MAG: hypothetical protein JOZ51_19200, partial [Chloroflexi bacterium]|nr:hypothetical protein [Chloroflexota bacterium]
MFRRFWLPLAGALVVMLALLAPARAADQRVFYTGLQTCYTTGSAIPNFTLTAEVATTDDYRLTHTVEQSGATETVYEGPIAAGSPRTVTITGGSATVPGNYTLTGRLYLVSSGVRLAQVQASVLIADTCLVPTPANPYPAPSDEAAAAPADVRWSQLATPSRGAATGSLLTVNLRAYNAGRGAGRSDAILSYDPAVLQLLDAQPQRRGDWIRARDDRRGTLTIAVGTLRPRDSAIVPVRFLVTGSASNTVLRLARDDGRDLGNPLFLMLGTQIDGPLELQAARNATTMRLSGRGFKPG